MSSNKNWVLQIDKPVYKFLSKIPRNDAVRILAAIENLPRDPFEGDIQKMRGEKNVWRKRVGSYRFRYELDVEKRLIKVFLAERRASKSY